MRDTRAVAAMFMLLLKTLNTCLDSGLSLQRQSAASESAGTVHHGKGRIKPLMGH